MSTSSTPSDPHVTAYVKLIRTAEALHAEVSRGLSPDGLTASQFSTLKVLRLRGPMAQKDIASYLLKTGGNVTVVVDNLERDGLVTRLRDPKDRRVAMVSLTESGRDLFDRIYPAHLDRIKRAMAGLGNESLGSFEEMLDHLHTMLTEPLCAILPADGAVDEIDHRAS